MNGITQLRYIVNGSGFVLVEGWLWEQRLYGGKERSIEASKQTEKRQKKKERKKRQMGEEKDEKNYSCSKMSNCIEMLALWGVNIMLAPKYVEIEFIYYLP